LLALSLASFFLFGVVLVLLGANQADLAADLGLDLARSGLLVAALSLGLGVGVVGSGPLIDRRPRRPIFVAAALVAALALLLVDASMGFARAFLHVALVGLGMGVYETLLNAAIGERYRERSAKPLVLAHAAATLGAMLGPLAVAWIAMERHWVESFQWTGAAHLVLVAGALVVRFPGPQRMRETGAAAEPAAPLSLGLLPFAVMGFAYVGIESALTIFAVPYTSALDLGTGRGRSAISALWFGLLAARLALLAARGRIDTRYLVGAGVLGSAALGVGIGLGWRQPELVFASVGVALGLVFPLMIALAGELFRDARATAVGLVAGAGALGGFAIPWLHGAIGDRVGVAPALASLALWSVVIAATARAARRGDST
jgi:DHA1 family inner membrane transport protein